VLTLSPLDPRNHSPIWDAACKFRRREHQMQTSSAPPNKVP
jgi:hypothetical protein